MAEEVADHVERDSALQQVHTLRVSQLMRTYGTVQTRTLASCQDDIFVKDVADSNGSVARGARFGKAASRTVRDDRVGFPASECVEAELCFPSKAQRAFCAPCPEGEAARVDPNARLRRRDRPTPEHAPQRRKGRSARPHLFDPVACGDLAVPRSRPTLLWKGSRRLDEHVSGAGWPGCFDTDAYGPALPPEHIERMRARRQGDDSVSGVKTFFLAPDNPGMLRCVERRPARDAVFPEQFPAHHGRIGAGE